MASPTLLVRSSCTSKFIGALRSRTRLLCSGAYFYPEPRHLSRRAICFLPAGGDRRPFLLHPQIPFLFSGGPLNSEDWGLPSEACSRSPHLTPRPSP